MVLETSDQIVSSSLPIYNLGALQVERELFENALANFQSCINLLEGLNLEKRGAICLWVPVVNNGNLTLEEQRDLDILETAKIALSIIKDFIKPKSNIDV
jgi:hypothetical protein